MAVAVATPGEEISAQSYVGFDCKSPKSLSLRHSDPSFSCIPSILIIIAITRQIEHKLLKRGFQFNVMVVGMYHFTWSCGPQLSYIGQTGLGKSTLINTLFASHLVESKGRLESDHQPRSTTEIHAQSHVITENGVRLKLNIIDTPGYGDQINNEGCWDSIIKYVSCRVVIRQVKTEKLILIDKRSTFGIPA